MNKHEMIQRKWLLTRVCDVEELGKWIFWSCHPPIDGGIPNYDMICLFIMEVKMNINETLKTSEINHVGAWYWDMDI